ncbi:hypothetical protein [Amycolatopsis alkalitolerans]|uniref:Uncharacterized protein n=1 Tax=Amycolatopsis alkalitolerans TaxID=2547244 RepID=A0A5C4M1R5_9PSEU|nr:hypothetical protein [Amycolatopsis alkalitolerans]TNC24573.1 hypothetical protein FG385_17350 [Amycolatopsis alkalitolerans]
MSDRAVHVTVQLRQVTVNAGDREVSLSYPGILLTGIEDGEQVWQRWVPFGEDPSEEDDERLLAAMHRALLWQQHELPGP